MSAPPDATVARLAAGVAHDLGHLLATVGLNLEVLARRAEGPARERLEALHAQVEDAAALARELAAVARPDAGRPAVAAPVDEVVAGLVGLVAAAHPSLDVHVGAGCPGVVARATPVDVRRCLLNLMVNSVEAGARRVEVAMGLVDLVGTEPLTWPAGRQGRFAAVDVVDDGPGPRPDQLEAAASGRGAGLGLPTTLAVLDRCGGALQLVAGDGGRHHLGLRLPLGAAPRRAAPRGGPA